MGNAGVKDVKAHVPARGREKLPEKTKKRELVSGPQLKKNIGIGHKKPDNKLEKRPDEKQPKDKKPKEVNPLCPIFLFYN